MRTANIWPSIIALGALLAAATQIAAAGSAHDSTGKARPSRLTNPLLKYVSFKELRPFKPVIEEKIIQAREKGDIESAAVYFRSLSDGMWFGINEREPFAPASVLKIPIMMAYYKQAERDPGILRKKIVYDIDSPEERTEAAAHSAVIGSHYTIEQLITLMITESDNSSASLLMRNLPPEDFVETFGYFGVDITAKGTTDNFVSLKISASLIRVLYNASYLDEEYSQRALEHLSKSTFRNGIRAGVPAGYTVANKFGLRSSDGAGIKQLHDVAIVYYPGNPYLLAVMTKGEDYSKLAGFISEISEITFREVTSQQEGQQKEQQRAIIE